MPEPRKILKLIFHCSAADNPAFDDIATIRSWHLERGFKDIGYHYVITKYTGIQIGRPEWQIGAHVKGHNKDSIGICLSGEKVFTAEQMDNAIKLALNLCHKYGLTEKNIFPHNHFTKMKTCPNFDILPIRQAVYRLLK